MIEALHQLDMQGWASHYAVVMLRVLGIFVFVPVFGSNMLPLRVRFAVVVVLTFVFMPLAPALLLPPTDAGAWAVVALRELAVGLGLGLAARAVFAGIELAAGLVAGQSGFSLARMVDPTSGEQVIAPAIFVNLLAIALFLAADLHHMLVRAIHHSYTLLPPAISLPEAGSLDQVASMLGLRLFGIAAELAAPALVVTVTIDLVMVLVGKAMPQVPILFVAYPFKMVAAFFAMGLLTWTLGAGIGLIGRTIASDGAAVLAAFAGS